MACRSRKLSAGPATAVSWVRQLTRGERTAVFRVSLSGELHDNPPGSIDQTILSLVIQSLQALYAMYDLTNPKLRSRISVASGKMRWISSRSRRVVPSIISVHAGSRGFHFALSDCLKPSG